MDLNKNTYVFFFSTAMVLVVAALLSFTSIKIKTSSAEKYRS